MSSVSTIKARAKPKFHFLLDVAAPEFFPSPWPPPLKVLAFWRLFSSRLTMLCAVERLRFRRAKLIALSHSPHLEGQCSTTFIAFCSYDVSIIVLPALSFFLFIYLFVYCCLITPICLTVSPPFLFFRRALYLLGYLLFIMLMTMRKFINYMSPLVFKVWVTLTKLLPLGPLKCVKPVKIISWVFFYLFF